MRNRQCVSATVKAKPSLGLTKKITILWAISARVTAVTAEKFTYRFQNIFCSNYFFSKNNRDFSRDNKTKYLRLPIYGLLLCLVYASLAVTSAVTKRGVEK